MGFWKVIFIIIICILAFYYIYNAFENSDSENFDSGYDSSSESDYVLLAAEPYIDSIVFDDVSLRVKASAIVRTCSSNDIECYINRIYRNIVENYNYYSDPRNGEFIQDPYQTMQIMGGDCEDLTILLNSLLENLGIKTYLVLTDNHAYSLACGVNTSLLQKYAEESLIQQYSKDYNLELSSEGLEGEIIFEDGELFYVSKYSETIELDSQKVLYYGGDGSLFNYPLMSLTINYDFSSSQPVTFFVVYSEDDYELYIDRENILSLCNLGRVANAKGECGPMYENGGVIIDNNDDDSAIVSLMIERKYLISSNSFLNELMNNGISYYNIENQTCVVLDATAGDYGYPGYDSNLTGTKIAIDPLNQNFYYLN